MAPSIINIDFFVATSTYFSKLAWNAYNFIKQKAQQTLLVIKIRLRKQGLIFIRTQRLSFLNRDVKARIFTLGIQNLILCPKRKKIRTLIAYSK